VLSSGSVSSQYKSQLTLHVCFLIRTVGGWSPNWVYSARRPLNGPIVPAPGDYDDGEFGGMKIGRGNRGTRREPAPVPLCPPQIKLDQIQV
jgi:hypothetical protein